MHLTLAKHHGLKQLSIGSGAQTIALLNTVPVWFELWRTLNGFLLTTMKYRIKSKEKKKNEIPNFIIIIIIRVDYAQQSR
jgi:hypothetical protein